MKVPRFPGSNKPNFGKSQVAKKKMQQVYISNLTEITDSIFFSDSRIFSRKLLLVACLENFSESKMESVIFDPSLSTWLSL